MSSDDARPTDAEAAPLADGSRKKGCSGCWVWLLIIGTLVIAGLIALRLWIPAKAAEMVGEIADERLAELQLPPEEEAAIRAPVDRLTEAIRHEKVGVDDVEELIGRLRSSPAIPAIAVRGFERRYIELGLTGEARQVGSKQANRFVQGLLARQIPEATLHRLFALTIVERPEAEPWERFALRDDLSPERVAEVVDLLRAAADEAGVPDGTVPIDYGALMDQAMDEALAGYD